MMPTLPRSPFRPGIGTLPPVMGHRPALETHLLWTLEELQDGEPIAFYTFRYDLCGSGKTVLLTWLESPTAACPSFTCASLMPEYLETNAALAHALETTVGHTADLRRVLQSFDFPLSAGLMDVSAQLCNRFRIPVPTESRWKHAADFAR